MLCQVGEYFAVQLGVAVTSGSVHHRNVLHMSLESNSHWQDKAVAFVDKIDKIKAVQI